MNKSLVSEKGGEVPVGPVSRNYCKTLTCFWFSNKNGQAGGEGKAPCWTGEAGGWPGKAPKATRPPFQRSALPRAAWVPATEHPQLPEGRLPSRAGGHAWGPCMRPVLPEVSEETIHKPQLFFGKFPLRPIVPQGTFLQLRARLAGPGPPQTCVVGFPG